MKTFKINQKPIGTIDKSIAELFLKKGDSEEARLLQYLRNPKDWLNQ